MSYNYQDIQDKSKEGLIKELSQGIGKMSFYFFTTYGMPYELFMEIFNEKEKSFGGQMLFYMNFRNMYPELF